MELRGKLRAGSPVMTALVVGVLVVGAGCSDGGGNWGGALQEEAAEEVSALLVAHRGASAYAPEHTLAAYELAIDQGADYVEPDLQITRDGVLIALHDLTLNRTTDVELVFPDRFRVDTVRGEPVQRWYANDFDLEEILRLDAGAWFGEEFAGARVPLFSEVIDVVRGRAGIFAETKAPEVYGDRGFDMERLVLVELSQHGLDRPGADPDTPIVIQSFSAASLRILRDELGTELPLTYLISGPDAEDWLSAEGLIRVRAFATGIAPTKSLLVNRPEVVARAHDAGLTVIPWTFGASRADQFDSLREEMARFLVDLGVDGLITNNPDLFPR
jgi:glycerophosphoryl diester phosphodiesterase